MRRFVILVALTSAGAAGCLGSSNSGQGPNDASATADTGLPPVNTADGSVNVDGAAPGDAGLDSPVGTGAATDAATTTVLVTGLGSGVVAHSAHFTVITKTGDEPGGAGVKGSPHFTVISGAAPAARK